MFGHGDFRWRLVRDHWAISGIEGRSFLNMSFRFSLQELVMVYPFVGMLRSPHVDESSRVSQAQPLNSLF
jgi:hypothetical protein